MSAYLSSCRHFVNLLDRYSEDLCNITNSKCLVLSFDDLNQFHGLFPIALEMVKTQGCISNPVVRKYSAGLKIRSIEVRAPLSRESHEMSPTLLAQLRQAI